MVRDLAEENKGAKRKLMAMLMRECGSRREVRHGAW